MTFTLLGIDPGQSTGWSYWALPSTSPAMRLEYGLIHRGTEGFIEFAGSRLSLLRPDVVIVEDWNRHDGRNGDPTDALQIKGALMALCPALGIELVVQSNAMKDQCRDLVLKTHRLYVENSEARTNPEILWKDARDINDSQRQALAWAKLNHEPTLEAFWPEDPD